MKSAETPDLFDALCVRRRRRRGWRYGADGNFLRREVEERIKERLSDFNRSFTKILDLGGDCQIIGSQIAAPDHPPGIPEDIFRQVDWEDLSAIDNGYDLVVSNLMLHSLNDPVGFLIQARHRLKPDGLGLFTLFGGETLFELRHALLAAEVEITGGAAARIAPFGDVRALGNLLGRAGYALPVADQDRITVTYDHPLKLMHELRMMGETNSLAERSRRPLRRDVLARACEIYFENFSDNGRIQATFDVVYLTGWAPDASQPKPLKPGSASMPLGEALKGRK